MGEGRKKGAIKRGDRIFEGGRAVERVDEEGDEDNRWGTGDEEGR